MERSIGSSRKQFRAKRKVYPRVMVSVERHEQLRKAARANNISIADQAEMEFRRAESVN